MNKVKIDSLNKLAYTKKEYPNDYNLQIKEAIKLLSAKGTKPIIFGSASLKSMIYAGDIDLMQPLSFSEQKKQIQEIIKNIVKNPEYGSTYQLGDIKIGTTDYGLLLQKEIGKYKNKKVIDYNPKNIKKIFDDLPSEIKNNYNIPKIPEDPNRNLGLWIELYYFIHGLSVIRWTPEEILKGVSKSGIKIEDAILSSTLSKIDLYFYLNGRFIEITNFYYDKSQDMGKSDMINGLQLNLLKYVYTEDKNFLKALKRLNAIARLNVNYEIIDKLKFILSGNIALLSSAKTDLEILILMSAYGYNLNKNKNKVMSHIGNIIQKISNIYIINISDDVNKILNNMQLQLSKNKNFSKIILDECENTIEYINNEINILTEEFIKKNNIKLII